MYIGITYIYIITAILLIKADIIKKGKELAKIVEEQEKIHGNPVWWADSNGKSCDCRLLFCKWCIQNSYRNFKEEDISGFL